MNITSPGVATIAAGHTFSIRQVPYCSLGGTTINVEGTLDATKGNYILSVTNLNILPGAKVTLGDTFAFQDGGSVTTITNQGTVVKTSGKGTFTVRYRGDFINEGSVIQDEGTISWGDGVTYNQQSGTTDVSNGAQMFYATPVTVNGGNIGGIGTLGGTINMSGGTLGAGSGNTYGSLNLNSTLNLGTGSITAAGIAGKTPGKAPGHYDQINSTSSMAIGGTLNLTFGSGFSPPPGHFFNILNFASSTGSFSKVITPDPTCKANLKSTSTSLNVSFKSSKVSVTISPKTVNLKVNTQQQFTDTVTHGCGNGVTWKVKEGSAGGTVTQTGLYTAPGSPGTFHVVVTSVAEPTKFATATVTVTTAANKIVVTPQAAVVQPGGRLQLRANQSVTWSVAEGVSGGRVTGNGTYTAAAKPGQYHVTATSTSDAASHATVNIAVVKGKLKSVYIANLDKNSVSVLAPVMGSGPSTGQLREVESAPAGKAPVALAISSQGTLLLSANQDSNDVARFRISSADGRLRTLSVRASETGPRPSAIALDRSGKLAFVTNRDSDDISVFSVAQATGQMVLLGKQALGAGDKPSAIAVHPGCPWLFVSSGEANTIRGFTYDAAGMLHPLNQAPLATGIGPAAALIDTAGRFVFTANHGSGSVSAFMIDEKNGTLQEVKGSPFATGKGAAAIAIDVTGSYLFVAHHESNEVATFQIDRETGGLTLVGRTAVAAAGPSGLAVDPSGQYVYVTSDQAGGVTSLKLTVSTGTLTVSASTLSPGRASAIVVTGSTAAAPVR